MKLDLPPQLEPTRKVLEDSLRLRPSEPPPAVPPGLLNDLNKRFASQRIVIEPGRRRAWLEGVKRLLASPGFGLSAAAIMILGVVTPILQHQSTPPSTERFRGIPGEVQVPAMILLVGGPPELGSNLAQSGQFEQDRLISVSDLAATRSIDNPKVVLDFSNSTIRAINEDGDTVYEGALPESIAELSLAVGETLGHL